MNSATEKPDHAPSALLDILPGGFRFRLAPVALIVALIGTDTVWMQGHLFGGPIWRGILWLLVGLGLGIGLLARLRQTFR